MSRKARWIGFPVVAAIFTLMAGCAGNTDFVYRPDPPSMGAPKLPVKVAVLPFEDGSENFIKRSPINSATQYNLVKTGVPGVLAALPPEFWGKSFADELEASVCFRSARFVHSPAELQGEGFHVDGTLKKVIYGSTTDLISGEFLVSFRATRRSDKKVVWEKEVIKTWADPNEVIFGGGLTGKAGDLMRARWNRWVGTLLAEARVDLVETLASLSESGTGAGAKPAGQPAPESVEQTIEKILKGK